MHEPEHPHNPGGTTQLRYQIHPCFYTGCCSQNFLAGGCHPLNSRKPIHRPYLLDHHSSIDFGSAGYLAVDDLAAKNEATLSRCGSAGRRSASHPYARAPSQPVGVRRGQDAKFTILSLPCAVHKMAWQGVSSAQHPKIYQVVTIIQITTQTSVPEHQDTWP